MRFIEGCVTTLGVGAVLGCCVGTALVATSNLEVGNGGYLGINRADGGKTILAGSVGTIQGAEKSLPVIAHLPWDKRETFADQRPQFLGLGMRLVGFVIPKQNRYIEDVPAPVPDCKCP